jgi:hypothetical protein
MDDFLPQHALAPAVRVSLIDYLVLDVVFQWNVRGATEEASAAARAKSRNRDSPEEAGARQRALIVLVAGELANDGFPLELGLRFGDPQRPRLDMATSAAIENAIASLIDGDCLTGSARGAPLTLTRYGDFMLQSVNRKVSEYEDLFATRLAGVFFLATDFVRHWPKEKPRVLLRQRISQLINRYHAGTSSELCDALIDLGHRFIVDGTAPRSYYFHRNFAELGRPAEGRRLQPRTALRSYAPQ